MSTEKDTNVTNQTDFHNDMIEIEKAENERKKTYTQDSHKHKDKTRARRLIVGAVFCFFALAGVVSIISGIFNTGAKIMDKEGEKQEYNALLTTLVMYDLLTKEPTPIPQHYKNAICRFEGKTLEELAKK